MDSDVMTSIYGQIVSGTKKEDSHLVTDDETSRAWDAIAKEVEAMRKKNPNVHFEIPGEIPGRPGTSVLGEGPPPATATAPTEEQPPAEGESEDEPPEEPAEEPPAEESEDDE